MEGNNFQIPSDYREPSSADNYMKLIVGENRLRILGNMVMGWEDWTEDRKPVRYRYNNKPAHPLTPTGKVKLFWTFPVWNYREERVQVLHVTQAKIRKPILKLADDEDWGNPCFYDLKITRTGEDLDTNYVVIPAKPSDISAKIKEEYASKKINLEALFDGKDPFENNQPNTFALFSPQPAVTKRNAAKRVRA